MLRDKLRAMTKLCLTPEQRQRDLVESLDDATTSWEKCELAHGRTPNELPGAPGADGIAQPGFVVNGGDR